MVAMAYENVALFLVLDDLKYYFLNYCALHRPRSKDLKAECMLNLDNVNFRCQIQDGLHDKLSTACFTTNLMKR